MSNSFQAKKHLAEKSTNRVFQTISLLDAQNRKNLLKFLQSPYFNTSKTLVVLYIQYLNLSNGGTKTFSKEKIWSQLFPGKPFNDVSFRKYSSDLLDLIENFLAAEIYFNDKNRVLLDKIEYISQQKIEPLYRNVITDNEIMFSGKTYFTQTDYYYAYQYEKKYHKLMNFDVKMNQKINIEKMSDNLDIFYLIDKLKTFCNALVQSKISSVQYNLNEIEPILLLCKKFNLSQHPELATYYYRYYTLTDGDNFEHYYNLKKVVIQNVHLIPQSEAIEILESTLGYCIGRANKGDKNFLPEYFELFLNGIQQGIFIVNDELAPWRFNNIVVVGLRLGKIEWADQFVETKKHLLPNDVRQNIILFNLARIASYKKEYRNVLDLIKDVEYDDIIINLTSKTMILFAYYELDEFDLLDSFIESFRTFLNRKKDIQSALKQSHLYLLSFVKKIMRTPSNDKKAIEQIRTDILAKKPNPVNREWLLEKLEELK